MARSFKLDGAVTDAHTLALVEEESTERGGTSYVSPTMFWE
jgi:hypothetical protein